MTGLIVLIVATAETFRLLYRLLVRVSLASSVEVHPLACGTTPVCPLGRLSDLCIESSLQVADQPVHSWTEVLLVFECLA